MTKLEELNEINILEDGVLEVTVITDKENFINEIKRIIGEKGYDVTQILNEKDVYHIHYK